MEDFKIGKDFVPAALPNAESVQAEKPERTEAHREAQRKGAINQWKAADRRAGIPEPLPRKATSSGKKTAIEELLLMQRAENLAIKASLDEFVRRTIEELGGWDNMTAGQKGMLVAQKTALLVILCCEDAIVESTNLLTEDGRPHRLLAVLRDFMSTFRQGQVALGLGLRSRMPREDNQSVQTIMQEYAKRQKRPSIVGAPKNVG